MDNVQCPSSVTLDLLAEMAVRQSSKTVTVEDILQTPPTVPTQPVERQVAEKVVRRMMEESDDNLIRLPTRGKVHGYSILRNHTSY